MPSEKILEQKKQQVVELSEQLKASVSGVLVSYKGITVADDTKLRKELREANVKYSVIKNTLVKRAAAIAGIDGLEPVLEGTTAVATSEGDYISPARILVKYAETSKTFEIKSGFMDGKVIEPSQITRLAKIPSKEILLAQVLGGFLAPLSGLAVVLNQIKEKKEAEEA
ncbi:MAG: 50S ribosomal protein L10 [Oscillospiraceae bacterium]|nr:50S ribosomal protein L10 [Oscillospiraceae bacterium]